MSWVLMTAMPFTRGHENMLRFAHNLNEDLNVIVCTMPHEPYVKERVAAVEDFVASNFYYGAVHHFDKVIPQTPEDAGDEDAFWRMWVDIFNHFGLVIENHESLVTSEPYGIELSKRLGIGFYPYNVDRSIQYTKATLVRDDPLGYWDDMSPHFQRQIRPVITFFGAESVGKTTISRRVAHNLKCSWLPEYAREYLETVGSEITEDSMFGIYQGQRSYQDHIGQIAHGLAVIQDTDLFSTLGYYRFWNRQVEPPLLEFDAIQRKSDLYIILGSNIPFEQDPLRYGGDKRESSDQYWIDLCEQYGLDYVVVDDPHLYARWSESTDRVSELINERLGNLRFERTFNE